MPRIRTRDVVLFAAAASAWGCESRKVPEPAPPAAQARAHAKDATAPAPLPSSAPAEASSAPGSPAALPAGLPRFAWKGPLSVGVTEDVDQQGQRMKFAYRLDVCPAPGGGVFVSHRDVTVKEIGGNPTSGKERSAEVRQIEAAASALPTMVVDASGTFLHGTGYPEMIQRATAAFPGEEFAQLRTFLSSGRAPAVLDLTLSQLWQGWVAVWLRFDPARGASQDAKDVGAGPGSSLIHFAYVGRTPEGHERIAAHRVPNRDELVRLAGVTGVQDADVPKVAVLDWDVETDWPDIRPYRAHSRRSVTLTEQGSAQTGAEEHAYVFDWRPSPANPPRCAK